MSEANMQRDSVAVAYPKLDRIATVLEKVVRVVGFGVGTLVLVMTVLLVMAALFRYVLHSPIGESVELSSFLFLLLSALGIAYTLQVGGHVNFSLIEDRLGARAKALDQLIASGICLAVYALFILGGWDIFSKSMSHGWASADMRLPLAYIQWVLPVGSGLLFIQGLVIFSRRLLVFINVRKAKSATGGESV